MNAYMHDRSKKHLKRHLKKRFFDKDRVYSVLFQNDLSSFLQLSGLGFLLLTIQIWQLRGYGRISILTFYLAILCICCASIHVIRYKRTLTARIQNNTLLLFFLETLMLVIICSNHGDIIAEIGTFREFVVVLGLFFCVAFQLVQFLFTTHKKHINRSLVIEISVLGGLCIFFGILLNIECFNTWPRWDAYHYFRNMELCSAEKMFLSGTEGLRVCGHISTAYALWVMFFRSFPLISHLNAMYLSNMVLIAISFALFYGIFKCLYPDNHRCLNLLYSIIGVSSPFVFGLSADLSVELILAVGVLLLVYSTFKNNLVLGIFSLFIVVTSKETGVLVAAMIIFVQLLYDVYRWHKVSKGGVFDKLTYYGLCLSLGISWVLQFYSSSWLGSKKSSDIATLDGVDFNQFAYSAIHIKDTLTGSLFTNFNWIFSLFIIAAVCLFIIQVLQKKVTILSFFNNQKYVIICLSLISYTLTLCAYVTFHNHRYYIITAAMLIILGLGSLQYILRTICNKRWLNIAMSIIISCLLLVESYVEIDPLTGLIYDSISTGKSVVVPIPVHSNVDVDPSFTDSVYANRMIMYFDKALDKAFTTIYNAGQPHQTEILFSNEYQARIIDGKATLGSLFCIWGFGYSVLDPPMWGHWSSEGGFRFLSYKKINNIDPSYVLADTDLSSFLNDYEHVYYIEMPWGDTVIGPLMERYPDISFYQTVEYRGWVLNIYRIK